MNIRLSQGPICCSHVTTSSESNKGGFESKEERGRVNILWSLSIHRIKRSNSDIMCFLSELARRAALIRGICKQQNLTVLI